MKTCSAGKVSRNQWLPAEVQYLSMYNLKVVSWLLSWKESLSQSYPEDGNRCLASSSTQQLGEIGPWSENGFLTGSRSGFTSWVILFSQSDPPRSLYGPPNVPVIIVLAEEQSERSPGMNYKMIRGGTVPQTFFSMCWNLAIKIHTHKTLWFDYFRETELPSMV